MIHINASIPPIMHQCYIDISTPDFPGTDLVNGNYAGLRPSRDFHPHLRLDECLVSVPKVYPGDTVYWHCDVIHAVEREHTGSGDSAGMALSFWSSFLQDWSWPLSRYSNVYSCCSSDASKSRVYRTTENILFIWREAPWFPKGQKRIDLRGCGDC